MLNAVDVMMNTIDGDPISTTLRTTRTFGF